MATNTRSILRYPGSKARFRDFIEKTISLNCKKPRTFAEPFCGGASVSIALLEDNIVDRIELNDIDPLIASLWKAVFSKDDSAWLSNQALTIPLTIDEWKKQKALAPITIRQAALKCLYLNRTSFNGIIHRSGPLGGWEQKNIKLDVRFNRERLANRILELSQLRDRVGVHNEEWRSFCEKIAKSKDALFYLDPPYYHKAEQLYGHIFDHLGHQKLRDFLKDFQTPWLLSYDDASDIRALYEGLSNNARVIDNTYSTHPLGGSSFVGRELVFTNMKRLPAPAKTGATHVGISIKAVRNQKTLTQMPLRTPISATAVNSLSALDQ